MNDLCPHCGEKLEDGSVLLPHAADGPTVELYGWHWECVLRNLIGGLNHLRGVCTCCGGSEPPDPPDMTLREAARAAVAEYQWVTQ